MHPKSKSFKEGLSHSLLVSIPFSSEMLLDRGRRELSHFFAVPGPDQILQSLGSLSDIKDPSLGSHGIGFYGEHHLRPEIRKEGFGKGLIPLLWARPDGIEDWGDSELVIFKRNDPFFRRNNEGLVFLPIPDRHGWRGDGIIEAN